MASSLRNRLEGSSLIWKQEPRPYANVANCNAIAVMASHDERSEDFIRDEDLPVLPSEHYTSVWEAILACL